MHPQIIQICEEIRKIFPTIELCAYSNGLIFNKFSDEEIIYLTKNLNLNIISSLYPNEKNLQEYKKQHKRFQQLNAPLYYQSSHFYFNKQNYKNEDSNLSNDLINNYYQNCRTITKYNNLITIYKNKVLTCCGEVGFLNNNKNIDISDLLDLTQLNNEQEIYNFCKNPHNICKICIANKEVDNNFVLWQQKNILTKKHQENSLKEIFLDNYNDYKELFLNSAEQLACFNDEFFTSKFLPEINPGELDYLNIKYKNGLGDILIQYTNQYSILEINKIRKYLYSIPNIDKYNIYFIGINTSYQINKIMFENFHIKSFQDKIKGTLLQAKTIWEGYKEFLKYSYLNNKIIININEIDN